MQKAILDTNIIVSAESNADFLITGNSVDFTVTHYKHTQILSPRSFWEMVINKGY